MTKQLQATLAAILVMSTLTVPAQVSSPAQGSTKSAKTSSKKKAPKESPLERQIRELREQMQNQQLEIDSLKQQNAAKDAALATVQQSAQGAEATAAAATAKAQTVDASVQENKQAVTNLQSTVTELQTTNTGLAQTISDTKKDLTEKVESPLAIHYKGVTITPVAFFAAESVNRQRSLNSDVNSPFNTTPFAGAGQAHVGEFVFSGRQSRIGALFQGDAHSVKMTGYVEADFLSAGVTSNSNESNSYTLRQRQIWGQAALPTGFKFTGGQMWSLVTETKKSTDNRTENLPQTIDAQYHVGFSWARQAALRFQQSFGHTTIAMSLENAQTLFGASNQNANFFIGNAGAGGGLNNYTTNYSNNIAPDIILKAAFDTHYGHYEIGGLTRFFRDRYYPNQTATAPATPSAAGGQNDTKVGAGFIANARLPITHYADFGVHVLGGKGVDRYGSSTLTDVTVHPDGTLAPIKGGQGLLSLELHPTKKLDLLGYAGAEYAQRTVYLSSIGADKGKFVGYAPITGSNAGCSVETLPTSGGNGFAGGAPYNPGTPANCAGATRVIEEATAQFIYRFYDSPKYGMLRYSVQYSYLTKTAWNGITSGTYGTPGATFAGPKANNNMVFTSFRYYLP